MKIKIEAMNGAMFQFSSRIGVGVGLLNGAVEIGDRLDVEINVDSVLSWARNIEGSDEIAPRMSIVGEKTEIVAKIESLDEDGIVTLRLDDDALLMVEVEDLPEDLNEHSFLRLMNVELQLFPFQT